ncbi:MAG: SBBP repeat-containing protein, partial [Phaeodactylibacter sp.]|nr:SBBP repeat-containing protein [Phaeodactylibacter sp.]
MSSPTLLWIRQIGSANPDFAAAIATDHEANVFISGSTSGDLDGQSRGSSDAFLAKFDAQGNQLWLKQLGAASEDRAYGIATDPMGNVFISGTTSGDLDGQSRGSSDAFLAKFDTRGNQLWLKQLGAARDDSAQAIATDQQGNVFISGYTSGDLDGQ